MTEVRVPGESVADRFSKFKDAPLAVRVFELAGPISRQRVKASLGEAVTPAKSIEAMSGDRDQGGWTSGAQFLTDAVKDVVKDKMRNAGVPPKDLEDQNKIIAGLSTEPIIREDIEAKLVGWRSGIERNRGVSAREDEIAQKQLRGVNSAQVLLGEILRLG